jgi:alkanesulfonate monooxygenase SsuD/methylene tetrahydromethanopterin reductase-like flavin-dependent oxidoreductase (luciferase family)
MFEAWTLLAGLALVTQRARIGILVSSNTFRHHALLVKQAVTFDHLSEGRLDLGLGAGWFVDEHEVFGVHFPDTKELVDRYLTHDASSFDEKYFRLDGAYNRPAPVQHPRPPLVLGSYGPRMLKLGWRISSRSHRRRSGLIWSNRLRTTSCPGSG